MLEKKDKQFKALALTIDTFTTLDLTGVGLVGELFKARLKHQKGPMCTRAAEMIAKRFENNDGPALIATGFPEGGGIPETDGPVGASMLARALFLGLGVNSVIVTDEDWLDCVKGACRGAGMVPLMLPVSGKVSKIEYLRPVFIKTVPKDWNKTRDISVELLETTKPRLMFAIERAGMNKHGVYHSMSGRVLNDLTTDLDYLFRKGQEIGIPFIGFGDGGNELGMGVIADDLATILPKAKDCGCPCGGGIASATAADILVVASVSNWAVTGVIAALALVTNNPAVMHEPEHEIRSIELCTACGGVDGLSMSPEPAVDGIKAAEWLGLLRAMKGIVYRGMGVIKDWRQLK
ncbi:MAG: DUF4392 domain-containing protein [Sedimentisphaerales bacterium]|nr:DUF4392 domain-containing protein [Sedimentisphaerales bacterium]